MTGGEFGVDMNLHPGSVSSAMIDPNSADAQLRIQPIALDDAGPLFDLAETDRQRLRVWFEWVDATTKLEHMETFVRRAIEERNRRASVHFVILENEKPCGIVGAHRIDETLKVAEVGYWIAKAAEGKGLVSASCRRLIALLFQEYAIDLVEIRAARENERSIAVARGLGFDDVAQSGDDRKRFTLTRSAYESR